MAPSTEEVDAHHANLDLLDINCAHKPFRNPNWKPNQRRNKNIKNILGDAVRKEASSVANQDSATASTPNPDESNLVAGENLLAGSSKQPNVAHTTKNLSRLAIERNTRPNSSGFAHGLTYSNIESAPSLAHSKHYCDITGLPAPYTDPKTRLRYHNKEVFGVIRSLGPGVAEQYLEARGAHTILK